jgi:hypothetical protein
VRHVRQGALAIVGFAHADTSLREIISSFDKLLPPPFLDGHINLLLVKETCAALRLPSLCFTMHGLLIHPFHLRRRIWSATDAGTS